MILRSLILFAFVAASATSFAASTEAASEKALNDMVRASLQTHGDAGTVPRPVEHFAYPVPGVKSLPRREIRKFLESRAYSVANTRQRGVVFEKVQVPADKKFDEETQSLRDSLARRGWDYDGWVTPVVTQ